MFHAHCLQNKASITFEKESRGKEPKTSLYWHSPLLHSCSLSDSSPNKLRVGLSELETGCSQACLLKAHVHHLNAPPTDLQLLLGNAPKCTSSTWCFHSPMLSNEYPTNFSSIRFPAGLRGCSALRCTCMAAMSAFQVPAFRLEEIMFKLKCCIIFTATIKTPMLS